MPASDVIQDVKPSCSSTGKDVHQEWLVQQSAVQVPGDSGAADEHVKREADVLNTPNLRMLATFLGDERVEEKASRERAVGMTSRTRSKSTATDVSVPPSKFVRHNASSSMPAFTKLSADGTTSR